MESLTTLIAKDTAIKEVPYSIVRSKNIEYISLCGYEGLTRDVFPSLIWSWMSPTMNSLPRISPIGNMTLSLTSINVQNNNMGFLSPLVRSLSQLRTVWVQCRSKIQLTQELRRILDDQYDVNFTKWETSSASHISNLSLRSLLIGMGSCHIVIDDLGKSISQGLTANDSSNFFLPSGISPSCLGYTGEGPSVLFQVPEDIDCYMKGIVLCVVYSSTSENMAAECLTGVLIVNYTKCTIQIYKRDTVMSFNGEDWKNVSSNLGPSDDVEIFVAFGHGLIVKETAVYLIYGQSITMEIESSTNMEMELPAEVNIQQSPEVDMQPSPNMKVDASTDVKANLLPDLKVQSSPIIKMDLPPKSNKSIFTRLGKKMGACLCLN